MTGRTGKWGEDEEIKLKDAVQTMAVQTHGGKNWDAIAALVPDRTKGQCRSKWHNASESSIHVTPVHTGTWTEDEDIKLKDAVQTRSGKNWNEIAALVPGRSRYHRWKDVWDPSIDRTTGRTGV